jgi:predicted O-linked N-acetylglucosamine transferase (SPINDLY family)
LIRAGAPPNQQLFLEAVRLQQAGQLDAAERLFRQVLASAPQHPDSLQLLGVICLQTGRLEAAADLIAKAIAIDARMPTYHNNMGRVLEKLGRVDDAIRSYRKAVELRPGYAIAYGNMGSALQAQGQLEQAVACFRKVANLQPGAWDNANRLGIALWQMGRLEEAVACFRDGLAGTPDNPQLCCNLANVLREMGQWQEAEEKFREALSAAPDAPEVLNNFAILLKEQGRLEEAEGLLRRARAIKPDYPAAHNNLGNVLYLRERFDDAIASYEKSLTLKPDSGTFSTLLVWLHYSARHSDEHVLALARGFAAQTEKPRQARGWRNDLNPDRPLRIGYVSADFRTHPVGFFLESVLKAHDPAAVEIFCYNNLAFADETTARLEQATAHWRNIAGLSDDAVAATIANDAIDILVDLSGHTDGNRLSLFAARAAPVQVTWLGFYGTTGLSNIDYILADNVVAPPGTESRFTEQVWRLPGCYLCYTPHPFDLPVGPFPAAANGFVTFGCFNKRQKISPGTLEAWATILKRVEGSRLFLKNLSMGDAACRARLIAQFAALGIEADRLILEGHSPVAEGLAAYNRVDIALDPFPFGGGTTTADCLWMGVPLVALAGERWVGRMSRSILTALNLDAWVAKDIEDYIELACRLAAELPVQTGFRQALRQRVESSAFCDGKSFTRGLEQAFHGMWDRWCETHAGRSP